MKRYSNSRTTTGLSGLALLTVTLRLLVEPNQLLLIAFVSYAIGTGTVGFVMMTYGLAAAAGCVLTGYVAKVTGRLPLICFATALHVALFVTLLAWRPQAHAGYVLYTVAVLWDLVDSVWLDTTGSCYPGGKRSHSQISASGIPSDSSSLTSPYFRLSEKIYLLAAMMMFGVICYFTVEYKERRRKNEFQLDKPLDYNACVAKGCDNYAFQKVE